MTAVNAQKYFTRSGMISFYSEAPVEKIEAVNNKVTSVVDFENSKMEFAVLIKAFQFEKSLMQEHFNENYMESSKFPKAIFKGTFEADSAITINIKDDGIYPVKIKGDLTIHGVTKPIEATANFIIKGGVINGNAEFNVLVADYDIEIPAVVRDNIAKEVKITVTNKYEELKG
jgi:polyisoprenoid-binding protein YceI